MWVDGLFWRHCLQRLIVVGFHLHRNLSVIAPLATTAAEQEAIANCCHCCSLSQPFRQWTQLFAQPFALPVKKVPVLVLAAMASVHMATTHAMHQFVDVADEPTFRLVLLPALATFCFPKSRFSFWQKLGPINFILLTHIVSLPHDLANTFYRLSLSHTVYLHPIIIIIYNQKLPITGSIN